MMFVVTFVFLLGLMGLMSVGVVLNGKRLQGSCGGKGADCACDAAGRPRVCETQPPQGQLSNAQESPIAQLPAGSKIGHSRL